MTEKLEEHNEKLATMEKLEIHADRKATKTLLGERPPRKYMERDSKKKVDKVDKKTRSEKSKRDALYGEELEEDEA